MEHREQNRSKQTWALAAALAVSVGGATVGGVTAGCGAMAGDVSSLEEGKRDFTVEARVSGGGDDAVESIGGVSLSSTQLELGAGAASNSPASALLSWRCPRGPR